MKVDILTREYPQHISGGAGVHVDQLAKVLAERIDVTVRAFDGPRTPDEVPAIASTHPKGSLAVSGYDVPHELADANPALSTFGVDLQMANDVDADLVHAHTWYTCLAGRLAQQLHGVPLVITAHSLEPFRPWKREQLGGGYELSSWAERDAYEHADRVIAVSAGMRQDILTAYPALDPDRVSVVHNGITLADFEEPAEDDDGWKVFDRYHIDRTKPTLLFVGRITQQKGLPFLLKALHLVDAGIQVVLCAGAPDTPRIGEEVKRAFAELDEERGNVIWIERMLPKNELNALEHGCDAFICPSIYEPLGIVNLEAMACGLPVIASATGGIPEVVDDGTTGVLVPLDQLHDGTGTPTKPEEFVHDMAKAINRVMADPERAKAMGRAGYARARDLFSWERIADQTIDVYRSVL
ncbi:MAG: glycogen synthase [Bifidobacterium mongoliense]|nr:glycogen synthase [Bifidobacterium mongoliense]